MVLRFLLVLLMFFCYKVSFANEEKIIGLLSLPQVFGDEQCEVFTPISISIFDEVEGKNIGAIKQNERVNENGGCYAITAISDLNTSSRKTGRLPTKAFDADSNEAVIVLEQKHGWYKVLVSDGTGWIKPALNSKFMPIEFLLSTFGAAYLSDEWDGYIFDKPNSLFKFYQGHKVDDMDVDILGSGMYENRLWFHVKKIAPIDAVDKGKNYKEVTGWVPAYSLEGDLNIWFSVYGC